MFLRNGAENRDRWNWSITGIIVAGKQTPPPNGFGNTKEEAMAGFRERWNLWLSDAELRDA